MNVRVPDKLLEQFDATCKSPQVDSDRSKVIRRLMREFTEKHKARNGAPA